MAAVLASGPERRDQPRSGPRPIPPVVPPPAAVLSHRSAAALWGIRRPTSGPAHVTLRRKSRSTGGIRRHVAAPAAGRGHRPRTASRSPPSRARSSTSPRPLPPTRSSSPCARREYRRLHDSLSLHDLLARYPGRRGARRVRLALARLAEAPRAAVRSPLEERLRPLPPPPPPSATPAQRLARGRREAPPGRLPLARHRQIVELDGWEGHGTRTAFREDRARDRRLLRRRLPRRPPHLEPARRRTGRQSPPTSDILLTAAGRSVTVITYAHRADRSRNRPRRRGDRRRRVPPSAGPRAASRRPAHPRPARGDGPLAARPRRALRGQRPDAVAGRARRDQPDAGGRRQDRRRAWS